MAVSVPFQTWHDNVQEHRRLARAGDKILRRWRLVALLSPFETWITRVQERKRLWRITHKVARQWRFRVLALALHRWQEAAAMNLLQRCLSSRGARALVRLRGAVMMRALKAWEAQSSARRWQRSKLARASAWVTWRGVLKAWAAWVEGMRRRRTLTRAHGVTQARCRRSTLSSVVRFWSCGAWRSRRGRSPMDAMPSCRPCAHL